MSAWDQNDTTATQTAASLFVLNSEWHSRDAGYVRRAPTKGTQRERRGRFKRNASMAQAAASRKHKVVAYVKDARAQAAACLKSKDGAARMHV